MSEKDEKDSPTVTVEGPSALSEIDRVAIDSQIQTAKWYPREISKFKKNLLELATLDAETAGDMFYALPRGGKTIEGPSVHLARCAAHCWTNLRVLVRNGTEGNQWVTAIGSGMDLEANVGATIEIRRSILGKDGNRYNEDMVNMTMNAARAIAYREAVFQLIPRPLIRAAYEAAKRASLGDGTLVERRERAVGWFVEHHQAKREDVLLVIGKSDLDDIKLDDLLRLNGLRTLIKDGETSWKRVVADARKERERARGATVEDLDSELSASDVTGRNDAKKD